MYSPSGIFQLQTLQSSATGKDQTRFTSKSDLRVAVSGLKTQAFHVNKEQRQESSLCYRKDTELSLGSLHPPTCGYQVPGLWHDTLKCPSVSDTVEAFSSGRRASTNRAGNDDPFCGS
jgi:hypothetical protein